MLMGLYHASPSKPRFGRSFILFWGSAAQTSFSGASVGLTFMTMRSLVRRGYFSASDKLVSSINCRAKPERPYEASRSVRSLSEKRVGSVECPVFVMRVTIFARRFPYHALRSASGTRAVQIFVL